ncbi:MAG: antitoxin ParD1/3/4 [Bacteroidia bacterium]|jgi:antitoxin ParD1/3/4
MFEKELNMKKTISISLGNHFEKFVQEKVSTEKYKSVGEVIRSALRHLEKEEKMESVFINTLATGDEYELVEEFDAERYMEELLIKSQRDKDNTA